MGEDLRGRERDGHLLVGDSHLGLSQIHAGGDGAVVRDDEAFGGEGELDAVKFVAVFKLAHVGVGVADGGQLLICWSWFSTVMEERTGGFSSRPPLKKPTAKQTMASSTPKMMSFPCLNRDRGETPRLT